MGPTSFDGPHECLGLTGRVVGQFCHFAEGLAQPRPLSVNLGLGPGQDAAVVVELEAVRDLLET